MAITVYKAVIANNKNGVFGISLVEDPAMESNFVTLNKQKQNIVKFATVKGEERTVCGVVMIPNKVIYRNDENGEYYITFDKDVIKQSAYSFLERGMQHNSTIEHEQEISGVSIVESWIVEDPKNDKANFHGLEVVAGAWVAKMKINNDSIWNDYVKTGLVKGFSIDGFFVFEKTNVNLKTNIKMKKSTVMAWLTSLGKKTELKRVPADDSKDLIFEYEGEELKEGLTLFVVKEASDDVEEVKTMAPKGIYFLEGKEVEVDEDGIISKISDAELTEEEAMELMKQHFEEPLKAENETLKTENASLKAELKKLKDADAEDPITKASLSRDEKSNATGAMAKLEEITNRNKK